MLRNLQNLFLYMQVSKSLSNLVEFTWNLILDMRTTSFETQLAIKNDMTMHTFLSRHVL